MDITIEDWNESYVKARSGTDTVGFMFAAVGYVCALEVALAHAQERVKELEQRQCTCDDFCDDPCPVHERENLLQDRAIKAENDLVTYIDQVKELRSELNACNSSCSSNFQEAKSYRIGNEKLRAEKKRLETENSTHKKQIKDLQVKVQTLEKENGDYHIKLSVVEREFRVRQDKVLELEENIERAHRRSRGLIDSCTELKEERDELKDRVKELEERCGSGPVTTSLQAQVEALKQENTQLIDRNLAWLKSNERLESENAELKRVAKNDDGSGIMEKLLSEKKELNEYLDKQGFGHAEKDVKDRVIGYAERLKTRIGELKGERTDFKAVAAGLQTDLHKIEQERDELKRRNERGFKRERELDSRILGLVRERDEFCRKLDDAVHGTLTQRVKALDKSVAKWLTEIDARTTSIEEGMHRQVDTNTAQGNAIRSLEERHKGYAMFHCALCEKVDDCKRGDKTSQGHVMCDEFKEKVPE